jgi:hypothetical protein
MKNSWGLICSSSQNPLCRTIPKLHVFTVLFYVFIDAFLNLVSKIYRQPVL